MLNSFQHPSRLPNEPEQVEKWTLKRVQGDVYWLGRYDSSMSRSRRKTPITGNTTARSDAHWKAMAARKLRRDVKQDLEATLSGAKHAGKRWDLVNPWSSEKDGKHYWRAPDPRLLRK